MLVWNGTAWVAVAPPTTESQVLTFDKGKIGWETSMNMLPLVRTLEYSYYFYSSFTVLIIKAEIIHFGGSEVTKYGLSEFNYDGSFFKNIISHKNNIKLGVFLDTLTALMGGVDNNLYVLDKYLAFYATNSYGTGYGNIINIKIKPGLVELNPLSITNITSNSVKAESYVNSSGGIPNLEKGFCWSTSPNPTINNDFIIDNDSYF